MALTMRSDDNAAPELAVGSELSSSGQLLRCVRCLQWKPVGDFHRSRTGQFSYCRNCRNAYDRSYYRTRGKAARNARKRAWLTAERKWMASLKHGIPCADCRCVFPVYVMHWDHLPDFQKTDSISAMVGSRRREAILQELKKCELVCANCHILRTIGRSRSRKLSAAVPVGVGGLEPPTTSAQG